MADGALAGEVHALPAALLEGVGAGRLWVIFLCLLAFFRKKRCDQNRLSSLVKGKRGRHCWGAVTTSRTTRLPGASSITSTPRGRSVGLAAAVVKEPRAWMARMMVAVVFMVAVG